MAQSTITDKTVKTKEICEAAFGNHPADVIAVIDHAAETLLQLSEIFETISSESDGSSRIKRLADAGAYIASDIANLTDARHEDFRESLRKAGLIPKG